MPSLLVALEGRPASRGYRKLAGNEFEGAALPLRVDHVLEAPSAFTGLKWRIDLCDAKKFYASNSRR